MEALDERLITALHAGADDLGFRIISPFVTADCNGKRVSVEGYLPDFGGPKGMLLVSYSRRLKLGRFDIPTSILPKESRRYVRKHVIAELKDWGWSGAGDAPPWINEA